MSFDIPFELPRCWEVKTVEQLIEEGIIAKPLDGNHGGIHPKSSDYVSEGIPFIMASDLDAGRVDLSGCKFITEKQAKTLRKGFANAGDVLISHKATIGRTAIVQDNDYPYIMLTPQVTYYRVIDNLKLSNVYLKAYFDSPFFQSLMALWAGSGSTRAYLGITGQLKLPVIIPPIDDQDFIANHVFTLNEKIELNIQTNKTLEQIAQALFKSWFVDFDPVKAKIKAKDEWLKNHPAPNQLKADSALPQGEGNHHSPLEGESKRASEAPRDSVGGIKRLYTPQALKHAKTLRQNQTDAEGLLWYYLRNKQMAGFKFRRQQPIGQYIVDFVCLPEKLIIELDGSQHADQQDYDQQGDAFLHAQGFTVLRFWNNQVFEQCFEVLEKIYQQLLPPPNQTAPDGLSSSTPPQGGSDLEEAMNLAAMGIIAAKSPEQLAKLKQSKPDAYEQLAQTASLFPSAMQESELGAVPEGWGLGRLSQIIDFNPRRSLKKGTIAPYLDMKNVPTVGHLALDVVNREMTSGTKFIKGDTLLARITPCLENGKTAYVDFLSNDQIGWGSTEYIVMRPQEGYPASVGYFLARDKDFRQYAISSMTGTSGRQRADAKALAELPWLIYPKEIIDIFDQTAVLYLALAKKNGDESKSLSSIRDELLSKLLSGEVTPRSNHLPQREDSGESQEACL